MTRQTLIAFMLVALLPSGATAQVTFERLLNADEAVQEAVRTGELGQLSRDDTGDTVDLAPEAGRERVLDAAADLHDFTHVLVADHAAGFQVRAAFIHMQIGAADIGGGDLDDRIGRLFDLRVGYLFDPNIAFSLPGDSFHAAGDTREPPPETGQVSRMPLCCQASGGRTLK